MNINTSLSIAASGLSAVQYELAVASQNVANASTPGYVAEVANVASRSSGGQGSGVGIQLTSRAVNDTLQNALYSQNAIVAGLGVTANALSAVSSVQGSTSATAGSSGTLSDEVGNLQDDFTTLESDPSSTTGQQSVVADASALADSINTLSSTYQTQRQGAQEAILSDVSSVNTSLSTIGSLSQSIVALKASGGDTADLENQRAAAMSTLSSLLKVNFNESQTGNMVVTTANGLVLPTNSHTGPLSTTDATIGASDAYPATIPGIMLGGQDVTGSLTGGTLGANITLRDQTLPTMQGELDSFSSTLANSLSAQGLTLFTDGAGNSPGSDPTLPAPDGELGFSSSIQVNSAVTTNPALVRDGTAAATTSTPVGSTTVISKVLNNAFGVGNDSLASLATSLTTSQAQTIANAAAEQTSQSDIQTTLQGSLTDSSGVSVDDQMANVVALQNAYEANAKVVATVQTMFSDLLTALS